MLESYQHRASWFVTLTYNEQNLPGDRSVSVRELQLFLKRLRKRVAPVKVRYFAVGEYGEHTWRPHYHLAVFGVEDSSVFAALWDKGFVHVGYLEPHSAAYLAGYVTKRLTKHDDPKLGGRRAEFARMSLKPGIGAGACQEIADKSDWHYRFTGDVSTVFRSGKEKFPLGRYLRSKIRLLYSGEIGQPEAVRQLSAALKMAEAYENGTVTFVDEAERERIGAASKAEFAASLRSTTRRL